MTEATAPDLWEQMDRQRILSNRDALRARVQELKAEGYTWFRFTDEAEHGVVVIEGWKVRPEKEGPYRFYCTPLTPEARS